MSDSVSDFVTIGQVGRPVGLAGWCRIHPQGKALWTAKLPFTAMAGARKPEQSVTIIETRGTEGNLQARFEGYADCTAIDRLKNLVLYMENSRLPETGESEFYHFELEGMEAFGLVSEAPMGKVIAVHNYPSVDALEIRKDDGATYEVPFSDAAVPKIDRNARRVYLDESFLEEIL